MITKSDINYIIDVINNKSYMTENGLKLHYYRSSGSYRVALRYPSTCEIEFKDDRKHTDIALHNFIILIGIIEENRKIDKDIILRVLKNCGFSYSR